ncbi:MAG: hypothetical protein KAU28_05805, partial [Phycisphaerae bacterium]|nr:hypothetical protein [Phycisphaerae bacterium]
MARRMYYTEEEAAAKLGCSVDELGQFVTEERIRVFKDGLRNVYTAEEVDTLAGERGIVSEEPKEIELAPAEPAEIELSTVDEEIELTPADTEKDEISLTELAEEPAPAAPKEDTVLSTEGA